MHPYKQFDPSPPYQCRDACIYLANTAKCKNTIELQNYSSIESYVTQTGKYGLVKLLSRYGDVQPQN